jgi:hypothetical protein
MDSSSGGIHYFNTFLLKIAMSYFITQFQLKCINLITSCRPFYLGCLCVCVMYLPVSTFYIVVVVVVVSGFRYVAIFV